MRNLGNLCSNWLRASTSLAVCGILLTTAGLALPHYSYAREWLGLTGVELAENHNAYAFAGAIAPLAADGTLGQGWAQRYWLDWVEYRFDSEGEEVRARAPGFSAAVGYQQSNSTGFWAAYAGAGYRKTTLTPDRPNAEVRGSQGSLQLLGELDRRFAQDWRFAGAVQYSVGPDSYWSRAKFLNKSSTATFWQGIAIVFQGDPDYKAYKLGLVLDELPVGSHVTANFKVGVNKTKGLKAGGYAGIEFVGFFGSK